MSLCINDDLIWISVPRCASYSIENTLFNSSLNIKHYKYGNDRVYPKHLHVPSTLLYNKFGKKETIVIKRNYFDRWISAFQHMFLSYEQNNIELLCKWEEVDNEFIYSNFSKEYIDSIYALNINDLNVVNYKDTIWIKEIIKQNTFKFKSIDSKVQVTDFAIQGAPSLMLLSQMLWVDNKKCTYEFDITEIDKFEKFISNRYDIDFKLEKLNESHPIKNNIVKDDKLKKWVWDNFEKPFEKRNSLI
jgi:hypothetical protein